MVEISIENDCVVFSVEGFDKLWAFRSRLDIPLAHIIRIEHDSEAVGRWWHGIRLMGTELPGLFAAGTFRYHGELVFWDVRNPKMAVTVSLDHERYKKLIVEVEDPAGTVQQIREALGHHRS